MSTIKDGGPAFPVPLNPGQPWQGMAPCDGMTLRDYFAAKALTGFAADPASAWKDGVDGMARCAYEWADAMLKARKGGA